MKDASTEILATVLAETFGDAYGSAFSAAMREDLARRVERALQQAVAAERTAIASLCLERQALWISTEARADSSGPLRAEARSRANEAGYLADAIQSRP